MSVPPFPCIYSLLDGQTLQLSLPLLPSEPELTVRTYGVLHCSLALPSAEDRHPRIPGKRVATRSTWPLPLRFTSRSRGLGMNECEQVWTPVHTVFIRCVAVSLLFPYRSVGSVSAGLRDSTIPAPLTTFLSTRINKRKIQQPHKPQPALGLNTHPGFGNSTPAPNVLQPARLLRLAPPGRPLAEFVPLVLGFNLPQLNASTQTQAGRRGQTHPRRRPQAGAHDLHDGKALSPGHCLRRTDVGRLHPGVEHLPCTHGRDEG